MNVTTLVALDRLSRCLPGRTSDRTRPPGRSGELTQTGAEIVEAPVHPPIALRAALRLRRDRCAGRRLPWTGPRTPPRAWRSWPPEAAVTLTASRSTSGAGRRVVVFATGAAILTAGIVAAVAVTAARRSPAAAPSSATTSQTAAPVEAAPAALRLADPVRTAEPPGVSPPAASSAVPVAPPTSRGSSPKAPAAATPARAPLLLPRRATWPTLPAHARDRRWRAAVHQRRAGSRPGPRSVAPRA